MKLTKKSKLSIGKYRGQTVLSVMNTDPKELLKLHDEGQITLDEETLDKTELLAEEVDLWFKSHKSYFTHPLEEI